MKTHEHAPLGGPFLTAPVAVLLMIVFAAALVLVDRFAFGLGSPTHLSNGYPWGIWIAIDLIIGTALGCGGFVTALLVYILNKGEYHPLARAGLATSLFGYSLGGLAVMIDIGRYWQGYNILLPWLFNTSSVLLETALCIFAYVIVLCIELLPAVFERFGMKQAQFKVHRVLFIFTGLGVLLPMMHQSSMGTVVEALGYQLSPLWQSQMLTVFFLLTALTMGFAVVAFESVTSSASLRRPFEMTLLGRLSGVMVWVMLFFVVVRYLDVARVGAWPLAFAGDVKAISFWAEFLLGVAGVLVLLPRANRFNPRWVFVGSSFMLLSGALYRLNCYLIGYEPLGNWQYFPSVGEILVTLGIFSLHILMYLAFVRFLPILQAVRPSAEARLA